MPAHQPSSTITEARYSGLRLAVLVRVAGLFEPAAAPIPVRFATVQHQQEIGAARAIPRVVQTRQGLTMGQPP